MKIGGLMKKLIWIVLLCLIVSGCGVSKGIVAGYTRSKLNKLEVGMTKEEVREIMGKPYKREAYGGAEYWLYYTEMRGGPIYGIEYKSDENFTPIAFVNGKVDGWGRNYYEERKRRIEADISIENR